VRIDLRTSLREALDVAAGTLVSVVGAGGKTSLMYRLAREIASAGGRALATTTTKVIYPPAGEVADVVLGEEIEETVAEVRRRLLPGRVVFAGRARLDAKVAGFSPAFVDVLHQADRSWTIIAECDGARGKSLKVPRADEPPVAGSTDLFVIVTGADCLGRPLTASEIFEPEMVASIAGVGVSDTIGPGILVRSVVSRDSYLGRRPPEARCCVFINKVGVEGFDRAGEDSDRSRMTCALEAGLALKGHAEIERVVYGSLNLKENGGFLVLR
jgi:probable selenium-dependent hydroxylase accessory protein YqeC